MIAVTYAFGKTSFNSPRQFQGGKKAPRRRYKRWDRIHFGSSENGAAPREGSIHAHRAPAVALSWCSTRPHNS